MLESVLVLGLRLAGAAAVGVAVHKQCAHVFAPLLTSFGVDHSTSGTIIAAQGIVMPSFTPVMAQFIAR